MIYLIPLNLTLMWNRIISTYKNSHLFNYLCKLRIYSFIHRKYYISYLNILKTLMKKCV